MVGGHYYRLDRNPQKISSKIIILIDYNRLHNNQSSTSANTTMSKGGDSTNKKTVNNSHIENVKNQIYKDLD